MKLWDDAICKNLNCFVQFCEKGSVKVKNRWCTYDGQYIIIWFIYKYNTQITRGNTGPECPV